MTPSFDELIEYLTAIITVEFMNQGHNLTGSLVASIEGIVREEKGDYVLEIWHNKYGRYLETGVPGSRIPFGGGGGGGGTSLFIQGLMDFVRKRRLVTGLGKDSVLGVAIAIAKTMKREGMPTRGSYRFTSNSRRKRFVSHPTDEKAKEIDEKVDAMMYQYALEVFDENIYDLLT